MSPDLVQELLIAADRHGEPVQPDRPFDPAQQQVVTRADQVNTGRHDAVVRRSGRAGQAGGLAAEVEELPDLLGQSRMECGGECGIASLRAAQALGGQQFLCPFSVDLANDQVEELGDDRLFETSRGRGLNEPGLLRPDPVSGLSEDGP
jgi:hypothetical protein